MTLTFIEDAPVHDRVLDTVGLRYKSPSTPGKVAAYLRALWRSDRCGVKDRDVGSHAGTDQATIIDPEKRRGLRSNAADRMFHRDRLLLAHKPSEQISRIARV